VVVRGNVTEINEAFPKIQLKPDCTSLVRGMALLVQLDASGGDGNARVQLNPTGVPADVQGNDRIT